MKIKKNSITKKIPFLICDSLDKTTGKTGLIPLGLTVTISKNCGAFEAPEGTIVEVGNGVYGLIPTANDTGTLGALILHAEAPGAQTIERELEIVAYDPDDTVRLGLTAIPNVAIGSAGSLPIADANGRVDLGKIEGQAFVAHTSGMIPVDLRHIVGAAVNTTLAQLGVRVVAQDNIDFGALQKTSLETAIDNKILLTNKKVDINDKTGFGLTGTERVKLASSQPDFDVATNGYVASMTTSVINAIANLNNLSSTQVATIIGMALDNLNDLSEAQVTALLNSSLATALATLNDISTSQVGTIVNTALTDIHLDRLVKNTGNPAAGSLLDKIMNKDGSQTFNQATDSLEANSEFEHQSESSAITVQQIINGMRTLVPTGALDSNSIEAQIKGTAKPTDKMDLVDTVNSTAVTALQNGLLKLATPLENTTVGYALQCIMAMFNGDYDYDTITKTYTFKNRAGTAFSQVQVSGPDTRHRVN